MASNIQTTSGKPSLWPAKYCSRCGGNGRYSWNAMHGDRCFGCSGTGVQPLNSKIAAIRTEYAEAVKAARRPHASQLEPGDRLAVYNGERGAMSFDGERGALAGARLDGSMPKNVEFATVINVEISEGTEDDWSGKSTVNGITTLYGWVTLTYGFDGEIKTAKLHEHQILIRDRKVDITPYMTRANEEAARVEQRAARKAARS